MPTPTFTKTGNKATTNAKLNKSVFDVDVKNHDLLKQAYVMHLANGRENLAKTLKRGEVRGGGKKPWKQKGTGRARFGSIRVPIWRGGGITFGPLGKENYTKSMTKNAKRLAIRQALTIKDKTGRVVVIDSFSSKDGKTSEAAKLLQKIGAKRKVLLVVDDKTPELVRATRNISELKLCQAMYVNVRSVLDADTIVFTTKALEITQEWLSTKAKKETK